MRHCYLLLLLLCAAQATAGEIHLTISGEKIAGQTIYVALHDKAKGFPGITPSTALRLEGSSAKVETTLSNISPGDYAISLYVDLNGNGKLDKNFIGIPNEPVAVSNNAKGHMGPPSFADARFHVGDGITQQTISLE